MLVLFAALASALVGAPLRSGGQRGGQGAGRGGGRGASDAGDPLDLIEERARLLAELRELDDDAASGRISAAERLSGRRALAPRLRAVTEALRATGLDARAGA